MKTDTGIGMKTGAGTVFPEKRARVARVFPVAFFLIAFFLLLNAFAASAATFTVTTGADEGTGSLRQAVQSANANGEDNIVNIGASVKEIVVSHTINITGRVTVNGRGATIRGSRASRLFSIAGGAAEFNRLTFIDGDAGSENGGAFYVDSTAGKARFVNCTFFGNRAGGSGGAVYVYGDGVDATTFVNCTIANNEAAAGGGGVAVYGGVVQFTASIAAGNRASAGADVYSGGNGTVLNSGRYNVVGESNAGISFPPAFGNTVSVVSTDIFKTPWQLATVDGVQVLTLVSATGNAALDLIPSANALNLPDIDERGVSRPQITAVDAGAFELSPVALASVDIVGGTYVQRGTTEPFRLKVWPEDATLDVRGYEDGIEWTVVNPVSGEVVSVDAFGGVTGLATGQATLRATAHGWNSSGVAITATDTRKITVGEDPLPAPTVSVAFRNPDQSMTRGRRQTLKIDLDVEPKDTPCTVLFESADPVTATVTQENSLSTTAVVEALEVGETTIRVTVTAENSKGRASADDAFLLSVQKGGGGGGGGCNGGFGVLAFAALAFGSLRRLIR